MSEALDAINRIRAFVADPTDRESTEWVAERLASYVDAVGALSLDEAFGVAASRDRWPWWRIESRMREREAAVRLIDAAGNPEDALKFLRRFAGGGRRLSDRDRLLDPKARAASDFVAATNGRVPESSKTLRRAAKHVDN